MQETYNSSTRCSSYLCAVSKLGRKRREDEFEKLTDDEVTSIEAIVRETFEVFDS